MITTKQYNVLKANYDNYLKMAKNYLKENNTNVIPVEVSKQWGFDSNNENTSKIEVYEFVKNPPHKYFTYVNYNLFGKKWITTFMGDKLGRICYLGTPYKDNFGGTRQSIKVFGINGVKYYGTYYKSSGDYCHLIAYKQQDKKINLFMSKG